MTSVLFAMPDHVSLDEFDVPGPNRMRPRLLLDVTHNRVTVKLLTGQGKQNLECGRG